MILSVGEILADMLSTPSKGSVLYERRAGGAPFNVACAAKQFGAKVAFIGSVGNDLVGKFLIDYAARRGLDLPLIRIDNHRNTTLAFVDIDDGGERSFCFYRQGTADAYLEEAPDTLLAQCDIIAVGSLMLSEEVGREYAARLMRRAKAMGKRVAFDVNFRSDIFPDGEYAKEVYEEVIALADIVKFSEDEVALFGEEYIASLSDKLLLITYGARGAEWRYAAKRNMLPSLQVKAVDTTGAGDAFFGAVLAKLDGSDYGEEALDGALEYACAAGALTTLGRGAIDALPTDAEVCALMQCGEQ